MMCCHWLILILLPLVHFTVSTLLLVDFNVFLCCRAVDPNSFFADPDPAVILNADPDPGGKMNADLDPA